MASRGLKTYSESRIELRNLQILKKMLEKSSQFCHQSTHDPRAWMLLWILQELKEKARKTCGCGQHWTPFDSSFQWKERCRRWKFVSSVVGDSQISLIYYRRHLIAAIQLAMSCGELYFSCCCALKQTGAFASESKVTCLFWLNLRSDDLMSHSWHQSVSAMILRWRKVEFF